IAAIIAAKILAPVIGQINIRKILMYLIFAAVPLIMVVVQPDLGTTTIILTIFIAVFIGAKPSWRVLVGMVIAMVIGLGLLLSNLHNLQPYQQQRIETFLNPASDPLGEGYNVIQSLIAVGSGGLSGQGFGQGSQTVLNFLPVPHADFIYAGYAEATGFIGSSILLILYVILVFRAITIARDSTDPFGQLLALGIATKFFFQTAVHIGMNVGLLPVTGIPLPFMSYGGTALIVDMALIGILESIAIRHKKIVFG
ncbi:MAG: FtsW/RodA/SpoVE family cell cycle protein, partial [Patescibacteria group bacterium]